MDTGIIPKFMGLPPHIKLRAVEAIKLMLKQKDFKDKEQIFLFDD
jgi:hypothetical protein